MTTPSHPFKKLGSWLALSLLLAPSVFAQGEAPGTVKATTKLRPDGSTATTIVNPDTRTAEERFTDAGGKLQKRTVFTLDERNFSIGATHYDGKGNIRFKERYKHDAMDRIAESELFSANDTPLGKRVFLYDSKGNAQIEDYDSAGRKISAPAPVSPGRPDKPSVRKAVPVRK